MKKTHILFVAITMLIALFASFAPLSAESKCGYTVTIMAYFDSENNGHTEPIEITCTQYGVNIVFDIDDFALLAPGYDFEFFIVNGVIHRQNRQDNRFFVKGDMLIEAVFAKAHPLQHAVVFADSNGKTIDVVYVEDGETVNEPALDYAMFSKPNHVVQSAETRWNGRLENITDSVVRVLQYQLNTASEFSLAVGNATTRTAPNGVQDEDKYVFNTVVTLEADAPTEGERFSHFEINGKIASYDPVYRFTVLEDTAVTAVYVNHEFSVTVASNILIRDVPLRDGRKSYVGQFYVPEGHIVRDLGIVRSNSLSSELDFSDDDQRISVYRYFAPTSEFLITIDADVAKIMGYVVTEDSAGEFHVTFSQPLQYEEINPYENLGDEMVDAFLDLLDIEDIDELYENEDFQEIMRVVNTDRPGGGYKGDEYILDNITIDGIVWDIYGMVDTAPGNFSLGFKRLIDRTIRESGLTVHPVMPPAASTPLPYPEYNFFTAYDIRNSVTDHSYGFRLDNSVIIVSNEPLTDFSGLSFYALRGLKRSADERITNRTFTVEISVTGEAGTFERVGAVQTSQAPPSALDVFDPENPVSHAFPYYEFLLSAAQRQAMPEEGYYVRLVFDGGVTNGGANVSRSRLVIDDFKVLFIEE